MKKKLILMVSIIISSVLMFGCGNSSTTKDSTSSTKDSTSKGVTTQIVEGATAYQGEKSAKLKEILDKGYITVGTGNDIPFAYIDQSTGKAEGIDVDIMEEICRRLGISKIQWKVMDWSVLFSELQKGNVDMVADGTFVKPERQKIVDFTNALYVEGESIVVKNDSTIKGKSDLKGKNVGTIIGWAYDGMLDEWIKDGVCAKKTLFQNQTECILALQKGSIDAAVIDGGSAQYIINKNTDSGIHIVENYQMECANYSADCIQFGNVDFVKQVNTVIDDMKKDGSLKKILAKNNLDDSFFVDVEEGKTKNSGDQ